LSPRQRGENYNKNLAKRLHRKQYTERQVKANICFSCRCPFKYHRIPIGIYVICDWCDDILTKRGYLQLDAWKRLYPDGTIKMMRWQIRDVLTGRID
jgi:hypothetical protein